MINREPFHVRLKRYRKKHDKSQRELAALLGIGEGAYNVLELYGQIPKNHEVISTIAEVLGETVADLEKELLSYGKNYYVPVKKADVRKHA